MTIRSWPLLFLLLVGEDTLLGRLPFEDSGEGCVGEKACAGGAGRPGKGRAVTSELAKA